MIKLDISFINDFQKAIFYCTKRNQCGSGGYGNGKTSVFAEKILTLCAKFPNYRAAIIRNSYTDLSKTTLPTFFKFCPESLYDTKLGGNRADSLGRLRLINGSEILWLHADSFDLNVIRGLEVNSIFIDQAEEISEEIYSHLDARVGRWDKADIPVDLDPSSFPLNPATGNPLAPSYMMISCNPDDYSHWIYRRYHPDSETHHEKRYDEYEKKYYSYSDDHIMFEAASYDNPALDPKTLRAMQRRGKAFKRRFVEGKWGIPEGAIHDISELSILDNVPPEFMEKIQTRGNLYRILDHASARPTVVLWFSAYQNWHFCYREYRSLGKISEHRIAIEDLSVAPGEAQLKENYIGSYADPSIFKKNSEKYGGYWSLSDEYIDMNVEAPPIHWLPADNNEFLTRNRIDEMLMIDPDLEHPITGVKGSPRLFFIKKSRAQPLGCVHAIEEIRAQKRKQIGLVNEEPSYSDERQDGIPDDAYDCIRYYFSIKPYWRPEKQSKSIEGTFLGAKQKAIRHYGLHKQDSIYGGYGIRIQ